MSKITSDGLTRLDTICQHWASKG